MKTSAGRTRDESPTGELKRRKFTGDFKQAFLAEYDAAPNGRKASLLARDRVHSSYVTRWRRDGATVRLGSDAETQDASGEEYLTPGEAGRLFHVSARTVSRWVDEGRIAHIRTPGGQRRIARRDIEQLVHFS